MSTITIVDYAAGNPTSVQRALAAMGVASQISAHAEDVARAERIIFPGVGHAKSTMEVLAARGLDQALCEADRRGTPIFGICIGAQLLLSRSEEGDTPCLDLVPGTVRRFSGLDPALKVPHMGWNRVQLRRSHPVLDGVPPDNEFYFVHSYYLAPAREDYVLGTSEHGFAFAAAFARENLVAVQFHPEKSGPLGLDLLARFARWDPGAKTC